MLYEGILPAANRKRGSRFDPHHDPRTEKPGRKQWDKAHLRVWKSRGKPALFPRKPAKGIPIESSEKSGSDIEYAKNYVPTEEDVLAARQQATEGMSQQQIENLTEVVKTANLWLEHKYMNGDFFEQLSDPNNLYWNYFHQTGEIQIGWAVDGGLDMDAVCEREKLSIEEFYAKYGTPVVTTNLYDADGFIGLLSEINSFIQNGNLKSELQYLMDQTEQAKETHRMEIVNDIYKKLHDLDYFLLRYGPKDVAKYVEDDSTVSKYYGTLPFY